MPTVVLDAVNGANLEHSADLTTYRRMGWVDAIELEADNDPDALVKIIPLLPPLGSSLGPLSPGLVFRRVGIKPDPNKFRRAILELIYDNQGPNFTPTAYLLRDRSFSVQKNTCFLPGTRTPIIVSHADPVDPDLNIADSPVFFNFNMTARSIELTVFMYGRPSAGTQDYVNYVNDGTWPTSGVVFNQFQFGGPSQPLSTATSKPKGYWRLNSYSSEYDRNKGMSLVRAEAITLVQEDWSELGMLRNELTGKFPFASLPAGTRISAMTSLLASAYSHGTVTTSLGITRVCPYPTTSFSSLLGF